MPDKRPPDLRLLHIVDLSARGPDDAVHVELAGEQSRDVLVKPNEFASKLAELCASGRCYARFSGGELSAHPAHWNGKPWKLELRVEASGNGGHALTGELVHGEQRMPLSAPRALHSAGLLYIERGDGLAPFDHGGAWLIAATLRNVPRVPLADGELPELLEIVYALPHGPRMVLPDDVSVAENRGRPRPWLSITSDASPWNITTPILTLGYQYGDVRIAGDHPREAIFDKASAALLHRDYEAEAAARERLATAGAREQVDGNPNTVPPRLTIARSRLAPLIVELVREGWRVEASGVRYRAPGTARAIVRSGIDWFDLDMVVDYGGATAPLPVLLDAVRKRQSTVKLSDGSVGLVPIDLLSRLGPAIAAGSLHGAATRFTRSQIGLLDALLAATPDVSIDETFERARAKLHAFEGIPPADPPSSFVGTLREYQREGLGWLHFLREFGLGGCLADDMGLGKTVQMLALLDAVRASDNAPTRPSIIVVPRSLVFNWLREAERFTPKLRVLDYSLSRRRAADIDIGSYDVVLTTYGLVRSDIAELSTIQFEYAILDEAQAIKNAGTASAKAARLLRARHRLALSGTPIENHLDELWSLFEFLNPGMLGSASTFSVMADLASDASLDDKSASRDVLRRALRPVILRRTKQQVAPELPERIEQTLYVDLEPAQREFYLHLLEETRRSVFSEVDRVGIGGARMHILTALLRLRQAACHPVLADPTRPNLPSAKLDALIPTLAEIVEEDHKAVVFSQFTSFLSLVRRRLEAEGVAYEYLDGATRDRESRVDRFQSPDGPPVFLVSLKAGGHGLNLTAADYVYLLDPWWNPAVEAQAIDRAHRIGQTRRVIATRLVARATIEEKVLELQASKRALADAILGVDEGGLSGIGREELEMLLSPER